MLTCPTVFLKIKRQCTLVQGQCSKIVTSAILPFHYLKRQSSKNSINSFSHSQLQYRLCDLVNEYYNAKLPIYSHAEVTIGARYLRQSVNCDALGQAVVGKLRLASRFCVDLPPE